MPELTVIETTGIYSSTLLAPLPIDGRRRTADERGIVFRAGRGLTPAERRDLTARRDAIAELLEPAYPNERAAEIYRLLKVMPAKDVGAAEAVRQDAYQEALEGLPAFAIVAARRAFFRGEITAVDGEPLSKRYPPTPPQLASMARAAALPYRQRLIEIASLLAAPEEPPAPALSAAETAARQRHVDERLRRLGFLVDPAGGPQDLEADRRRALAGLGEA
jgi:hypothetical protein